MNDPILQSWLEYQYQEGMQLARESDILRLEALAGETPDRYIARFHAKTLARPTNEEPVEVSAFSVGIWFPENYLRECEPARVLTLLEPARCFHPNVRYPLICPGKIGAGTSLKDLLYQLYEIFTYQKYTWLEYDALNREACVWARDHAERLPVDRRPLKRRQIRVQLHAKERE